MIATEKWKMKLLVDAKKRREDALSQALINLTKRQDDIQTTYEAKCLVIRELREEPEDIFGDQNLYVRSSNHETVHDVVRALRVQLDRKAGGDGFNFGGKFKDIDVLVYGMTEVPHCRIVKTEVMKPIVTYEAVCNDVKDKGSE